MDPVTAAFERSAKRFADKAGIAPSQEEQMAATAKKDNLPKTAGENAENDMAGSQLQTGIDQGDYSPQSAEVGKQKTETAGAAPDGTDMAGTQNQSADYDDESYSANSAGGARVAAMRTVMRIADVDPKAAAKFLHLAEGGDIGVPMGGEPASIGAGEEAAEEPGAPAPAPEAGMPSPDEQAQVKLQDVIHNQDQQIEVDRAVNEKLKDIQKEIGASLKVANPQLVPEPVPEPQPDRAGQPPKKVLPPSITKDEQNEDAPTTDNTIHAQYSKGATVSHPKLGKGRIIGVSKSVVAIEFPNLPGPMMVAKTALERSDEGGNSPAMEAGGDKVPHASTDTDDKHQTDGDPDWTLYDQSRDTTETNEGETYNAQELSDSGDRDYKLSVKKLKEAQRLIRAKADEMVASGMDPKEAIRQLAQTQLGRAVQAATKKMKRIDAMRKRGAEDATGREVGGNTPPDEQKSDQADDTTRYDAAEQGDTSPDSVSDGTDTTLESPETGSGIADARGELDKKHNEDTKGSTQAIFNKNERQKIVAELKKIDASHDALKQYVQKISPFVTTNPAREAIKAVATELRRDLKKSGDVIESCLKTARGDRHELRSKVANTVLVARPMVKSARHVAALLGALAKEANQHREKFARVSPAFKLAIGQVSHGMLGLEELASKVAEYIKLNKQSFDVVARTVADMSKRTASRRPPSRKTASWLPSVTTEASGRHQPTDELTGIFDDDV